MEKGVAVAMEKLNYLKCKPYLDKFLSKLHCVLGSDLLAVVLFGSVARGEGTAHSDIDLLIVHRNVETDLSETVARLVVELRKEPECRALREMGFRAEIFNVLLSEDELKATPWVLLDVQEHGLILVDKGDILKQKFASLRRRLQELGSRKVVLPDGAWYWDLKPDWKPGEEVVL